MIWGGGCRQTSFLIIFAGLHRFYNRNRWFQGVRSSMLISFRWVVTVGKVLLILTSCVGGFIALSINLAVCCIEYYLRLAPGCSIWLHVVLGLASIPFIYCLLGESWGREFVCYCQLFSGITIRIPHPRSHRLSRYNTSTLPWHSVLSVLCLATRDVGSVWIQQQS